MISEFVISAVEKEQWPESDLPEVVVVGRSNVGKSSFINTLLNRKVDKIPKTKRVRALKDISQQLHLPMKNIFGISSTEKTGFEPVLERINEIVEQAKKQSVLFLYNIQKIANVSTMTYN